MISFEEKKNIFKDTNGTEISVKRHAVNLEKLYLSILFLFIRERGEALALFYAILTGHL